MRTRRHRYGREVVGVDSGAQAFAQGTQDLVSDGMAVSIFDVLEAVDGAEQEGRPAVGASSLGREGSLVRSVLERRISPVRGPN